jgi:glycosyltransferase involved in cell wall biosynthesis
MELAGNREDIHFIDGYLNHYENHALLELSDVFLSLHRSEGYGINLADAMARRTLVVATGYSGNLEFMDQSSSVLVPFELTKVTKYAGITVDSVWAEPDLDFCAHTLRELSQNKEKVERLRHAGHSRIVQQNSLPAAVKQFKKEFMNG